jgi:PTH1 family peptidyl-tRNA hydrolase
MPAGKLYFVVGLGNPGEKYQGTRHNIGFAVIDAVSSTYGIKLDKRKFDAVYGKGRVKDKDVILAKPQSYMNRSGIPIQRLLTYYKISFQDMLVIHDDIDLTFGRIKIKVKGGHGGHNGVRSIMDACGNDEFTRVRMGIGRSEKGAGVTNHVLGRFQKSDEDRLDQIVVRSRDAVVTILCEGTKEGMNRYNERIIQPSS